MHNMAGVLDAQDAARFRAAIKTDFGFPKPGVPFADIVPCLKVPDMLDRVTSAFADALNGVDADLVIGIEARGLVFGAPLAVKMGRGFVMARKQGSTPGGTASAPYRSEYGEGVIELSKRSVSDGMRCVVVDDFLATGGTARAVTTCVKSLGGTVSAYAFFIEDPQQGGRTALEAERIVSALTL